MWSLQRCALPSCVEWVERDGPDLPLVFCCPGHLQAWEMLRRGRVVLPATARCQWCWTRLCTEHSPRCPAAA